MFLLYNTIVFDMIIWDAKDGKSLEKENKVFRVSKAV